MIENREMKDQHLSSSVGNSSALALQQLTMYKGVDRFVKRLCSQEDEILQRPSEEDLSLATSLNEFCEWLKLLRRLPPTNGTLSLGHVRGRKFRRMSDAAWQSSIFDEYSRNMCQNLSGDRPSLHSTNRDFFPGSVHTPDSLRNHDPANNIIF
jgi:hypothetical protein